MISIELIQEKKFQIFGLVIVVLAVLIIVSFFGFREKTPLFGEIDGPKLESSVNLRARRIEVDLTTKRDIPKKALVYKLNRASLPAKEIFELAKAFGFSGSIVSIKPYEWVQGKKSLMVKKDLSQILFKNVQVAAEKKGLNEQELVSIAKKYLSSKGLNDENLEVERKLKYLSSSTTHIGYVGNFKRAGFVEVRFNRKFDGLFVFGKSPTASSVSLILNKKGKVFSLNYNRFRVASEGPYPLKSINRAGEAIASQGVLVTTSVETESSPVILEKYTNIVIEDYFLAYFGVEGANFLQPIYIFRGRASVGSLEIDVAIYVPALEDKWLK